MLIYIKYTSLTMDLLVDFACDDTHQRVSGLMMWSEPQIQTVCRRPVGTYFLISSMFLSLLALVAYTSFPGQTALPIIRDQSVREMRSMSSIGSADSATQLSDVRVSATPAARRELRIQKRTFIDPSFKPAAPDSGPPQVTPWNKRGVYLTAGSVKRTGFFQDTQDSLKAHAGNAIIFDVKGTSVFFETSSPLAKQFGLVRPLYDLPAIVRSLHENGIYTIGRFIAVSDSGLTQAAPQTRLKNPVTGRVISEYWIDPADPTAIEYNMQVLCDIAAAGIDEVNLDCIRFSTESPETLSVYSGKEKADRVEVFVKSARETIDRCHPTTKLGISTYAILGWNFPVNLETLGQDVVRFAPYVDVISPMAYPATFAEGHYYIPGKNSGSRMYYLVYHTLTGYRDLLPEADRHKLRPWIQGYGVTVQNIKDQMQAVYDSGSCGFTVWNANNNYGPVYTAMQSISEPDICRDMGLPPTL